MGLGAGKVGQRASVQQRADLGPYGLTVGRVEVGRGPAGIEIPPKSVAPDGGRVIRIFLGQGTLEELEVGHEQDAVNVLEGERRVARVAGERVGREQSGRRIWSGR